MNRIDLQKEINSWESFSYNYNLGDRPMRHNELGMLLIDGKWQVYQSFERGGYNIIKAFDNESDACECLLDYLRSEKRSQEYFKKIKRD